MKPVKDYVATAQLIALDAHGGQVDKVGRDYVEHPQRVAAAVAYLGPQHEAAGWLHDVIEDSEWTLSDVIAFGETCQTPFPHEVIAAVRALTKDRYETYLDAVRRAASNPIARAVKLADNADNTDPARLALLEPETAGYLRQKYARARAVLVQDED